MSVRVPNVNERRRIPMRAIRAVAKQLAQRLALGDFFLREIIERGQVLYERSAARYGNHQGSSRS
jgi:hypothetical protein